MLGPLGTGGEQLEVANAITNASSSHEQRHHKMLVHHKSDDAWLVRNDVREESDSTVEKKRKKTGTKSEVEEGLEMLENLVHPEDELQDEEDDRQIFQAVVTSMAQWNLRKIQKLKEKQSNSTR